MSYAEHQLGREPWVQEVGLYLERHQAVITVNPLTLKVIYAYGSVRLRRQRRIVDGVEQVTAIDVLSFTHSDDAELRQDLAALRG